MNKPIAGFGMNMHFSEWFVRDASAVNAQHQVRVCGAPVQIAQFFTTEVPVGIEPVRVPCGEQQFFGAVGFRQSARQLRRPEMLRRPGSARGGGTRLVPFEQQGRHLGRSFAGWRGGGRRGGLRLFHLGLRLRFRRRLSSFPASRTWRRRRWTYRLTRWLTRSRT